jgi:hypothetical protein
VKPKGTNKNLQPIDLISKRDYDNIPWDKLTTQDLLKENSQGLCFAAIAAKRGVFFHLPKKIITEEILTQDVSSDQYDKIIHLLTRSEQVRTIPKKLLTEKLLSTQGDYGDSCYHILAQDNNAMFIPDGLWTRTALTLQNNSGETPLHDICENDCEAIPKEITLEDLLIKSNTGITPLHTWANSASWTKIPNEYLTRKTIELPMGETRLTLLNCLVEQYENQKESPWASKSDIELMDNKMKKILSLTSDKNIKSLSNRKESHVVPLAKQEIGKRMIMKKISEAEKGIQI